MMLRYVRMRLILEKLVAHHRIVEDWGLLHTNDTRPRSTV